MCSVFTGISEERPSGGGGEISPTSFGVLELVAFVEAGPSTDGPGVNTSAGLALFTARRSSP